MSNLRRTVLVLGFLATGAASSVTAAHAQGSVLSTLSGALAAQSRSGSGPAQNTPQSLAPFIYLAPAEGTIVHSSTPSSKPAQPKPSTSAKSGTYGGSGGGQKLPGFEGEGDRGEGID